MEVTQSHNNYNDTVFYLVDGSNAESQQLQHLGYTVFSW